MEPKNKNLLIVIDMQNDFITGSLANADADAIVPDIVKLINNWDGPIAVTMDTHNADYMHTHEGSKLPIPHCVFNTDGWEIDSRIAEALKDKNVKYIKKDSFGYDNWKSLSPNLITPKETCITLTGTCTDICVVSNALILRSLFPENDIHVISKLCAGTTKQNHEAALAIMGSCQIDID